MCGVRGDEAWTAPVRADFDALGRDDELRAALGRLPESLRQVVVLRVFLDYSHTEIAETPRHHGHGVPGATLAAGSSSSAPSSSGRRAARPPRCA
jgi:hypothetical protein